jgi:hypothetical protein
MVASRLQNAEAEAVWQALIRSGCNIDKVGLVCPAVAVHNKPDTDQEGDWSIPRE